MALTLDVIRPARPNGAGVLWIQSARWRSPWADPKVWPVLARPFLDRGFTVFVVRHGSAPRYNLPEIVEDVRLSVRFIRLKAGEFGVDRQRLGAFGSSAAGHLSLLLGTTGDDGDPQAKEEVLRQSSRVGAVVAVAPPTDLRGWVIDAPEEVKKITTRKAWRLYDGETAPSCSPLLHVSGRTAPTLLIHGDNDELVPIDHSNAMLAELEKHKVAAKLVVVEGGGHVFDQTQNQDLVLPTAVEWLDRQLAEKTEHAAP
jgi:acetyl esterase/lipase